jgi:iron(III) transport system substrate-binding protein
MPSIQRRTILHLAGAAGLGTVLVQGHAADAPDLSGARAEGKLTFYANITGAQSIVEAFNQDTGVKASYSYQLLPNLMRKVRAEGKAGRVLADVVQGPQPLLEQLKAEGLLAPYQPPAAANYPEWARPDDTVHLFGIECVSYVYNTDHVKAADAPRRYQDLADPKWRDRIVMPDPATHPHTISWLVNLKEKVFASEDDWIAFLRAVDANRPMIVASLGATAAPVASGEMLIAVSMPKYVVTQSPAPLDWGPKGEQPLFGTARAIALAAGAPHPAAGRAFIDYWLSDKSANMLAKGVGEYVAAPGVFPPLTGIEQATVLAGRGIPEDEILQWGVRLKQIFRNTTRIPATIRARRRSS